MSMPAAFAPILRAAYQKVLLGKSRAPFCGMRAVSSRRGKKPRCAACMRRHPAGKGSTLCSMHAVSSRRKKAALCICIFYAVAACPASTSHVRASVRFASRRVKPEPPHPHL